jgi:hypothetical protein
MHIGDKQHIKNAKLQIVIYKHEVLSKKDTYDYEICSIYKCNHVKLHDIEKLATNIKPSFYQELCIIDLKAKRRWKNPLIIDILEKLDKECFYLFTFVYKKHELLYKKHEKITPKDLKKDPLLGLH